MERHAEAGLQGLSWQLQPRAHSVNDSCCSLWHGWTPVTLSSRSSSLPTAPGPSSPDITPTVPGITQPGSPRQTCNPSHTDPHGTPPGPGAPPRRRQAYQSRGEQQGALGLAGGQGQVGCQGRVSASCTGVEEPLEEKMPTTGFARGLWEPLHTQGPGQRSEQ